MAEARTSAATNRREGQHEAATANQDVNRVTKIALPKQHIPGLVDSRGQPIRSAGVGMGPPHQPAMGVANIGFGGARLQA